MNDRNTGVSGKIWRQSLLLGLLLTMMSPATNVASKPPTVDIVQRKYHIDYLPEVDRLLHDKQLLTVMVLDNEGNLLLIQGPSRASRAAYRKTMRAYRASLQRNQDNPFSETPILPPRPIASESVIWRYRPATKGTGHGHLTRLGTVPGECYAVAGANHAVGQLAIGWTLPYSPSDSKTLRTSSARLELPPRVAKPKVTALSSGVAAGMDANGDMVGSNDKSLPCLYPAGSTTPVLLPLPEDAKGGFANAICGDRIAGYFVRPIVVTSGRNTFHNNARLPVVWHLSPGADRTVSASWKREQLPTVPDAETPIVGINDIASDGTVVGWTIPPKATLTEPCVWIPTATGYRLQLLTYSENYPHQQGLAVQVNDLGQVLFYTTDQKVPFEEEDPDALPARTRYQHIWQKGEFLKIPVEGLYTINGKGQMLVMLPDKRRGMPKGAVRIAILTPRK